MVYGVTSAPTIPDLYSINTNLSSSSLTWVASKQFTIDLTILRILLSLIEYPIKIIGYSMNIVINLAAR